jgi:hypothetical protein
MVISSAVWRDNGRITGSRDIRTTGDHRDAL